jgi:DNA ligase 3
MEYKVEEVKEYILKSTDADSIIMDGEILLIDNKTGLPLPFGTLGKHKSTQYSDSNIAVFIFDILYLNGKSLINTPLEMRRKILEKVVK